MACPCLERYIEVNGLTLRAFAHKCRIQPSSMYGLLHNKNVNIQKKDIDKILNATGLTYEEAFKEVDNL